VHLTTEPFLQEASAVHLTAAQKKEREKRKSNKKEKKKNKKNKSNKFKLNDYIQSLSCKRPAQCT